jgi:hypothetical protein
VLGACRVALYHVFLCAVEDADDTLLSEAMGAMDVHINALVEATQALFGSELLRDSAKALESGLDSIMY